jgi:hypothetical protein
VDNDKLTSGPEQVAAAGLETEGLILGSHDAMPLEFWVGVEEGRQLELDDLVMVETVSPRGPTVRFFGIVDVVRKRYEGAQYDRTRSALRKAHCPWMCRTLPTCR